MELVHDFTVPVPPDRAFAILTDVERVGPCLPGAAITAVNGDTFEGGMKVKVGPVSMTFRGDGELVEKSPDQGRVVLQAQGRDAKGNGGARASVTAVLHGRDHATDVHVVTDVTITGKAAQFGSGVVRDVSDRLLGQFAENLAQQIGPAPDGDRGAAEEPIERTAGARAHGVGPSSAPQDELNLIGVLAGSGTTRTALVVTAAGLGGLVVGYLYGANRTMERMLTRAR